MRRWVMVCAGSTGVASMKRSIESQPGACADRPCHRRDEWVEPSHIQADAGARRKLEVAFEHRAAGGQVSDPSVELQRTVRHASREVRNFLARAGCASVLHLQFRFRALTFHLHPILT